MSRYWYYIHDDRLKRRNLFAESRMWLICTACIWYLLEERGYICLNLGLFDFLTFFRSFFDSGLREGKFATIRVGMRRKVGNRLCLKAVVLLHIFEDLKPAVHDVLMPFIFFKMGSNFGPGLARGFVGWGGFLSRAETVWLFWVSVMAIVGIEISGSFDSAYPNYICVGQWNATQQSSAKNSPATENFLSGPPVRWNIGSTQLFHIPDHG
ncbi:hypothetical protein B0H14DRAFT_2612411 [Mycena olivaceomarginata]|nr:hypothetical protein B0H14DRAFT_2612411 [Mycena olivaceomarginata]